MEEFIKGRVLSAGFFQDCAKPILQTHFPTLPYSAGFLGYGSDVLGYDDVISTDHMWGPRFYLFLKEKDLSIKDKIMELFSQELPCQYKGYSVNFSPPDENDGGIRHQEWKENGPISPLIFIDSIPGYLKSYLGIRKLEKLSLLDWLAFSEHRLLACTVGTLFEDMLGLGSELEAIRFYPREVKLFLLSSNWSLLAEEQAFVKRCADVGDEMGSLLACARICERLMRLCFLYCDRYAPYSKWFGTAFSHLPIKQQLKTALHQAVRAGSIGDREDNLVLAQSMVADIHNASRLTDPIPVNIQSYFDRPIQVIYADRFSAALTRTYQNTPLASYPLIGTLSQVSNFVTLSDNPTYRENLKALYDPLGHRDQ